MVLAKFFDRIEEYLLIILFPIMTIVVFAATVSRYFQLVPMPWSEELARYIMVWMAYIGASLGVKRNAHLGVEVVVNLLPSGLKKIADIIRVAIVVLFSALIVYFSYKIIMHQINIKQTSPALFMPIWIAYLAVPVGCLMMSVRLIQGTFFVTKKAD
ncbi:TRAP transporter small permease subunit [Thermanaerosceptrum fracticalcis]|uniref:TRAP transporter small permease subunit n=1 Tax=Thermanaerosceptrum fracticalcis TaxID=1712410 RepID=A0A7G6E768_THEFR|nr:TRAP transporter small permease subunit [Thermanaerosceptrum fracticalcis]